MHFKQGAGRGPICRWQLPTDDVQIVDGVQLAGVHFFFLRWRPNATKYGQSELAGTRYSGRAIGGSAVQTGGG